MQLCVKLNFINPTFYIFMNIFPHDSTNYRFSYTPPNLWHTKLVINDTTFHFL